jgi:hypothetical protein
MTNEPQKFIKDFFSHFDLKISQIIENFFNSHAGKRSNLVKDDLNGKNIIYSIENSNAYLGNKAYLEIRDRINDVRDEAMNFFADNLPDFIQNFLELYDSKSLEQYDKEAGLNPERRGRVLEVPDILGGTGFTAWLTPFNPNEILVPHNHTVQVASYMIEGTLKEYKYITTKDTLTKINEKIRRKGHHSFLHPRKDNIHSYINDSDEPALSMHFCFQCRQNGIDTPVKEVFPDFIKATGELSPQNFMWQAQPPQKDEDGFWVRKAGCDIDRTNLWSKVIECGYTKALSNYFSVK